MRAKHVNEETNFERVGDPKISMGVGKAARAKNMLEELYKNHKFLTYSIKSLDQIEIFYTKKFRESFKDDGDYIHDVWIFQFIEKERFFSKPGKHYRNELDIWELQLIQTSDPDNIGFKEKYVLSMDDKDELKISLILQTFNNHYGKIEGLELIEKRNESQTDK